MQNNQKPLLLIPQKYCSSLGYMHFLYLQQVTIYIFAFNTIIANSQLLISLQLTCAITISYVSMKFSNPSLAWLITSYIVYGCAWGNLNVSAFDHMCMLVPTHLQPVATCSAPTLYSQQLAGQLPIQLATPIRLQTLFLSISSQLLQQNMLSSYSYSNTQTEKQLAEVK